MIEKLKRLGIARITVVPFRISLNWKKKTV